MICAKAHVPASSYRGFSLVELLIAMAIFAISITGFTGALLSGQRANQLAKEITDATALAQSRLEEFPTASSDWAAASGTIYSRRTQVVPNSPRSGVRTVIVSVRWQNGVTRQIHLRSIYGD